LQSYSFIRTFENPKLKNQTYHNMKNILYFAVAALMLAPIQVTAGNKADKTLKVMSYNIRVGSAGDGTNSWNVRCGATIEMLKDKKPDVFGVQEALDFQIKFINDFAPQYKCVGVGREDGKKEGEHMSIFYNKKRISLLKWGTYWLSETPDVPSKGWDAACFRTATWALLKDKETVKKFYFVNTHLDHVGVLARKNGLALIVNKIKEMNKEGYPMVLTGDFNVTPDNPGLVDLDKMMLSARKYAEDSDTSYSFNGWGHSKEIIDYVYYSGFSKCPDFKVVNKQYGDYMFVSDHYPVMAALVF